MRLTIAPRGILQFDDARIIFKNFEGRGDKFNREGDRNFALVIEGGEVCERPDEGYRQVDAQEMAEVLTNMTNQYGASWNVKIRPARDEDEEPFIYMSVKVKFNDRGPKIILETGNNRKPLTEETVECLDYADIISVDLDIRPYDDVVNGKPFRAAYLQGMKVVQEDDRFSI